MGSRTTTWSILRTKSTITDEKVLVRGELRRRRRRKSSREVGSRIVSVMCYFSLSVEGSSARARLRRNSVCLCLCADEVAVVVVVTVLWTHFFCVYIAIIPCFRFQSAVSFSSISLVRCECFLCRDFLYFFITLKSL